MGLEKVWVAYSNVHEFILRILIGYEFIVGHKKWYDFDRFSAGFRWFTRTIGKWGCFPVAAISSIIGTLISFVFTNLLFAHMCVYS